MTIFCTYCSAEKEPAAGLLPAIERYRSERIRRIHDASQLAGCGFRILSGEYGMLEAATPIPWYDHLLQPEEAPAHAETIAGQLRAAGIGQVLFFTLPVAVDPSLAAYHEALRRACRAAGADVRFIDIDFA